MGGHDHNKTMITDGKQTMSLSDRLKAARETSGWTVEEVGVRLRLPAKVIQRIESGDIEALGAPVYRRGYLRSFARLVGVPEDDVEAVLNEQRGSDPELVATGVTPRGQYVTERYLRPVTYIALTALIAVPVVWYAASGRLGEELARSRSFDLRVPVVATESASPSSAQAGATDDPRSRSLMRASLLPAPPEQMTVVPRTVAPAAAGPTQSTAETGDAAEPVNESVGAEPIPAGVEVIGSGRHLIVLELTADSWVNVLDGRGGQVHQSVLKPGTWHFRSDQSLSFTIGNSRQAQLRVNGKAVDLAAHRSPNDVARVELPGNEG